MEKRAERTHWVNSLTVGSLYAISGLFFAMYVKSIAIDIYSATKYSDWRAPLPGSDFVSDFTLFNALLLLFAGKFVSEYYASKRHDDLVARLTE